MAVSGATAESTLNAAKNQLNILNQQVSLLERGGNLDFEQVKQTIANVVPTLQALKQGIVNTQGATIQSGNSNSNTLNARNLGPGSKGTGGVSELQLRRADQMLSECQLIETTIQRYEHKARQAAQQQKKTESLVGNLNRPKTDYSAMDNLEQERQALLYTRKRIQQINGQSSGILEQLTEQGRRLAGVGDKVGDMLESIGVSNTTILHIVRRNKGDAWIVYGGIIVLLFLLWYIW